MESNHKSKETDIKNRMCYFNDITEIEDFDFNILLDEKA